MLICPNAIASPFNRPPLRAHARNYPHANEFVRARLRLPLFAISLRNSPKKIPVLHSALGDAGGGGGGGGGG